MTHAYDSIYLSKASHTIGNMLHAAVYAYDMNGEVFFHQFIQSGIAKEIENGNPKYIAGKSGMELFLDVTESTIDYIPTADVLDYYERSDAYWVGWMLTHYQWYSGRTFKEILDTIPYDELIGLYGILHEADIQKSYEVLDTHFLSSESKLKIVRKRCGITQEELSVLSGVSLNTIRAYERKSKDINKAQAVIVKKLANALKCDLSEILN